MFASPRAKHIFLKSARERDNNKIIKNRKFEIKIQLLYTSIRLL